MPSSEIVRCLLFVTLLFTLISIVTRAQVVCRDNGCDNTDSCCSTSGSCTKEHTLLNEMSKSECTPHAPPIDPPVDRCPFDTDFFSYNHCLGSLSDEPSQTVGDFGKPDWVGAEFQSLDYDAFSMTVMWQHKDADRLQLRDDYSDVKGYEIRIYEKDHEDYTILRDCLCVTDTSRRNVTSTVELEYVSNKQALSYMIVEVRSYPSLSTAIERSTRKNCSLLTGCAKKNTSEDCVSSFDDDRCYSWPQSCLDFPSYNSKTCSPPLYDKPNSVTNETSLYYDSSINDTALQLTLSWEPPSIANILFPMPNIYYIAVEAIEYQNNIIYNFQAINTTSVIIPSLNASIQRYRVTVSAYVVCSGLATSSSTSLAGCGNESIVYISEPYPHMEITSYHNTEMTSSITITDLPTVGDDKNMDIFYIIVPVVAIALTVTVVVLSVVCTIKIIVKKRHATTAEYVVPNCSFIIAPPPVPKTTVDVFVFYPKDTESEEALFIQTYIVAPLYAYSAIKSIKSADDPDFERGIIPESVDRNFRCVDFVLIVCNSLLLHEWNSDYCSPTVRLLRHYMGKVSICNDDSINKFITIVLDEEHKKQLIQSRQNLGLLRSFVINEQTLDEEIPKIVGYMTGSPLFQMSNQEESLNLLATLDSPGPPASPNSPVYDVPNSSQESQYTSTPRTSNSSLCDTDSSRNPPYTLHCELA